MDMAAAGIRTARAGVFTALCVTLSAGGHVLLSGAPLPLVPLLLITVSVFVLAFALADRERGYGRIAALLIPLELCADAVFTSGQHACYGAAGGPVTGPLHSVGIDLLCAGGGMGSGLSRVASGAAPLSAPGVQGVPPADAPWLLLALHVAVGLCAAAWLRRGEAAVARLLRAAAVTAFRPLLLVVRWLGPRPEPVTGPRAVGSSDVVHRPPLLTHSVLRRGPPRVWASA
jgi:hypothetical protein